MAVQGRVRLHGGVGQGSSSIGLLCGAWYKEAPHRELGRVSKTGLGLVVVVCGVVKVGGRGEGVS